MPVPAINCYSMLTTTNRILWPLLVVLLPLAGKAQNIIAAEYFWDTDPGMGNGKNIPGITPSTNVNIIAAVSSTGLSQGFHFLYTRARDASGKWGLFDGTIAYVAAPGTPNITVMEYFWDTDPGAGNGTASPVGTPAATVNNISTISAAGISQGIHYLYTRAKDATGIWGLFDGTIVYVGAPPPSATIKLEYFWDSDPGTGNGTPLTPVSPGVTINESFSVVSPHTISQGNHILVVRSLNENNVWSLFDIDTVTIVGILPVEWLSFTGEKENTQISLTWITGNENNNSFFDVERSINGVNFIAIGKIMAGNNPGTVQYHYTDSMPLPGVNYYRIRQTDKNGMATYSKQIRIFNNQDQNMSLQVLPNPARQQVYLLFPGREKKVIITIYDARGRLVQQLVQENSGSLPVNISSLRAGMYFIRLSDGITLANGQFIKE